MIDKETLKKRNLKAVPFSCIGEGQTFNIEIDFLYPERWLVDCLRRKHSGGTVWANNNKNCISPPDILTVYVPVWRPC
jgi:hypothetical protein